MIQTDVPLLAEDPGRPSTATLGIRFMRSEFSMLLDRAMRAVGVRKLYDITPGDWAIPDSQFAKEAIQYAETLCTPYMIQHCFRSYCFGATLAARNKLKLDRELFFVAAMLHDLGLADAHDATPGSFEWVGARLARNFSLQQDQTELVANTIHNAIALHTSVGIAGTHHPEVALLHYGTGMDLFGMRLDEVPKLTLENIVLQYPRDDFKARFSKCLSHQAEIKPDSQIAAAIGIGITDRILENLC